MIRPVKIEDAKEISDIYNYYVLHTTVTFEEDPVTPEEMQERIQKITSTLPFIVYEEDGKLLGYAYASKWKDRSAYRYNVEATVYLNHDQKGKGIGTKLYNHLFFELRSLNIHSVLGVLGLPNEASEALHEKLGFKKVGHLSEVGYKFSQWLDVGIWQLNMKS